MATEVALWTCISCLILWRYWGGLGGETRFVCWLEEEDSVARIPTVTRESVPEDQRMTFDEFVQQRGRCADSWTWLHHAQCPRGGKTRAGVGADTSAKMLPVAQNQELAMLTTARGLDCQFIWNAHAPLGRRTGLRAEIIDNLRDKKELRRPWHPMRPRWCTMAV